MGHVFPEDMKDYTAEDWEAFEEEQRLQREANKALLFDVFCWRCGALGYWRMDGQYGLRELAYYFAEAIGEEGVFKEEVEAEDAEGRRRGREIVHGYFYDVAEAMQSLIADGLVELFTKDNWPHFRPVAGFEAIAKWRGDGPIEEYRDRQVLHRRLDYKAYLQTEEWQERRKRKLAEAGNRCQLCGSSERLEVHHRTYERRGNELMSDLIVLCRDCHGTFHQSGRKVGQ